MGLRDGGGRLWDRDQPLLLWRCPPASWGPQLCGCLHQICSPFQPHESLASVRVHGTPSLGQTSGPGLHMGTPGAPPPRAHLAQPHCQT